MRAIVHSIHSQVPETVAGLGERPDTIVSMDSHLDVSLGGDEEVYPKELQIIVARTAAHSALRNLVGGVSAIGGAGAKGQGPRLIIAVPEAMFARHAMDVESRLPRSLRVSGQEQTISSAVEFLADSMGIEVYMSPPKSLQGLVARTRRSGRWVLDVDVDYMEEMQDECYTRIFKPAPGVLQSASRVVEFIRKSKPETITISEAKVAAIRDPGSEFSAFVGKLRDAGYTVEERGVYKTDAEVVKGIRVCREFYREVTSKLIAAHMDEMMEGRMAGFRREEAVAAKEFFRKKGY